MATRSGKLRNGSCRIRNVARADRTRPAVSGIPSSTHVPKVTTDTKTGAPQNMNVTAAGAGGADVNADAAAADVGDVNAAHANASHSNCPSAPTRPTRRLVPA